MLKVISSLQSINTTNRDMPLRHSPFHPALLSNAPLGDFGLTLKTSTSHYFPQIT